MHEQRKEAVNKALAIYRTEILLGTLPAGLESRERIAEATAEAPLIGGINDRAMGLLCNPEIKPSLSILDHYAVNDTRTIALPVADEQPYTQEIMADDTSENSLPIAVLRASASETSMVLFDQGISSNWKTKTGTPAVVIRIVDEGDRGIKVAGYHAVYTLNSGNVESNGILQDIQGEQVVFNQQLTPNTEKELVASGFLSPAEYQAALSLVSAR